MKKIIFIGVLFLAGCYEHIPNGVIAQMTSERYLDSLYKPNKVVNKIGVGFIPLKKYSDLSKRRKFQQDTDAYYVPKINWEVFTKKVNNILSKEKASVNGVISVESYQINGARHTTAFFVDSTLTKVFATIQLK